MMAYKVKDAVKRDLNKRFEEVCNGYLLELCRMWELDCEKYGFWIGDDVGGTFSYGDTGLFISMDDIRYCVINNVTYSEYLEWLEYCVWAEEFKQAVPNLEAWHHGCQRVDEKTQERLSAMKYELAKLIEETKEKI